eukprot:5320533-Alexandrium_andersonii.AAC.1
MPSCCLACGLAGEPLPAFKQSKLSEWIRPKHSGELGATRSSPESSGELRRAPESFRELRG